MESCVSLKPVVVTYRSHESFHRNRFKFWAESFSGFRSRSSWRPGRAGSSRRLQKIVNRGTSSDGCPMGNDKSLSASYHSFPTFRQTLKLHSGHDKIRVWGNTGVLSKDEDGKPRFYVVLTAQGRTAGNVSCDTWIKGRKFKDFVSAFGIPLR